MKTILQFIFIAFVVFSPDAAAQKKENKTLLEGKTFNIRLTKIEGKRGGWQWTKDEISFTEKKMASKEMFDHEKFPGAVYKTSVDSSSGEKVIKVTCEMFNPGISQIIWEGEIKKDKIEGKATWSNGQGKQLFSFKGNLK